MDTGIAGQLENPIGATAIRFTRRAAISGAAMLAVAARAGLAAPPTPRFTVDTLVIGEPWTTGKAALANGLDGVVLDLGIQPRGNREAVDYLEMVRRTGALPDPGFRLVLRDADFDAARAERTLGVVLTCQDAAILGVPSYSYGNENLDNLEELHLKGLRILQPSHNQRNGVGDSFMEATDSGLSRLGRAVVAKMNALRMIVDLSHSSDLTCAQTLAASTRPCIVSHGGCRALFDSPRNRTDAQLRTLADKGGYFGVFMMTRWLTAEPVASVEDVVDHIDHAVKVGGIDLVGFGSDQPIEGDPMPQAEKVAQLANWQTHNLGICGVEPLHGHVTAADLDRPDRMRLLAAALERRGYRGERLDRLMGGNFRRVFASVCG